MLGVDTKINGIKGALEIDMCVSRQLSLEKDALIKQWHDKSVSSK